MGHCVPGSAMKSSLRAPRYVLTESLRSCAELRERWTPIGHQGHSRLMVRPRPHLSCGQPVAVHLSLARSASIELRGHVAIGLAPGAVTPGLCLINLDPTSTNELGALL